MAKLREASVSRRSVLKSVASAAALAALEPSLRGAATTQPASARDYHVCLTSEAIAADPELLKAVHDAGVRHVWMPAFFYGHWPFAMRELVAGRAQIEAAGMAGHVLNCALGHPGNSLGTAQDTFPIAPPKHWKMGVSVDGEIYSGTSLHAPATAENVAAVKTLQQAGFDKLFLDDDFRLTRAPGLIGGCFCDEHRARFLQLHAYAPAQWDELKNDVRTRRRSALLDAWIEFTCDELTACFRSQQQAAGKMTLQTMAMYMGGEKAGIRLSDYGDVPVRVGEGVFDDQSFGGTKEKTSELFSALLHRRFVEPDLAYSETTAFPPGALSAQNLAAKLVVSTIADVRHTMFMSGIHPFAREDWAVLAPHMRRHAEAHATLAGHRPRGPFKHFWSDDDRRVGDDNPNGLFLASGVPFEVTDAPASDGFTFLSAFGARQAAEGRLKTNGTTFVFAPSSAPPNLGRPMPESLDALFALKREIIQKQPDVPVVEEEQPVACAWYPTANAVLLWNLSSERQSLHLLRNGQRRAVTIDPLDFQLVTTAG